MYIVIDEIMKKYVYLKYIVSTIICFIVAFVFLVSLFTLLL